MIPVFFKSLRIGYDESQLKTWPYIFSERLTLLHFLQIHQMLLCCASSEFAAALLSHGKGVAFHIQPSTGTLKAFQQLSIEITAYNNMWGEYQDDLVCKVREASVLSEVFLWQILHQWFFPASCLLKALLQFVRACVRIQGRYCYATASKPCVRNNRSLLQCMI